MSDSNVHIASDTKKPVPIVTTNELTSNMWLYPSALSAVISFVLSGATIAFVYLLTVSYPDTLPGPTWILAMISYMPLITAFLLFPHCLVQTYAMSFVVLLTIWLMYPQAVQVPIYVGVPFGLGFFVLTSLSVHLWSRRFQTDEMLGIQWIVRYSCMFMITAYTINMVYGNLVSHAIQLFRVPFLLQPISIFGFGSVEFLLILTNACLAWWIYASVKTRRILPIDFGALDGETRLARSKRFFCNPIILLISSWILWVSIAGIVKASHTIDSNSRVVVATVGGVPFSDVEAATELGMQIAIQAKRTGATFIVTPEFSLQADFHQSCESLIVNHLYPQISGLGLHVVVGCFQRTNKRCSQENLAITLSPQGRILGVHGKLQPTPGEQSCYQPGVSVQTIPYDDATHRPSFGISALICYDMDFLGPTAQAADMGASLILNPANDWLGVRHHYAVLVIRAIENRVAIVKAERNLDPAIVDPFGNIIALGTKRNPYISGQVHFSTPLKISWIRQHMIYWICILMYAVFISMDIIRVYKRRYQ